MNTTTPTALPELARIGELIRTQDNRITDAPIFIVQQRRRIWGVAEGYTENFAWVDSDCQRTFTDEEKEADDAEHEEDGLPLRNVEQVGYIDIWEFVTACFTEQGCKDYLARDGHNLREPHVYAAGSYRNEEWRTVRKHLMDGQQCRALGDGGRALWQAIDEAARKSCESGGFDNIDEVIPWMLDRARELGAAPPTPGPRVAGGEELTAATIYETLRARWAHFALTDDEMKARAFDLAADYEVLQRLRPSAAQGEAPVAWMLPSGHDAMVDRDMTERWRREYTVPLYAAPLASMAPVAVDAMRAEMDAASGHDKPGARAYLAGWLACARWAKRDDLNADTDSPAYIRERDAALAGMGDARDGVIVPDWPSRDMQQAGSMEGRWSFAEVTDIYRAMLAAAQPGSRHE